MDANERSFRLARSLYQKKNAVKKFVTKKCPNLNKLFHIFRRVKVLEELSIGIKRRNLLL